MAIAVLDAHVALERQVSRRLRGEESRRRVSSALAEVAAAAIHPASRGGPGGPTMSGVLEDPVASATQVAVETLIDELEDFVDSLPSSMLDSLAAEQLAADLGIE
jgi:hypothetical protein